MQVVTAVSEAFNNIVLHSYAGRSDGVVEMRIDTSGDRISIELRDWGDSFDPRSVPKPDLDSLPESGLGIYIMQQLMDIQYRPGRPNVLVLTKTLSPKPRSGERGPFGGGGRSRGSLCGTAADPLSDERPVEGDA